MKSNKTINLKKNNINNSNNVDHKNKKTISLKDIQFIKNSNNIVVSYDANVHDDRYFLLVSHLIMQTAINEVDLSFCKGDLEMIIFENSGCITMVVEYLHGLIDEFVVTKNLNDLSSYGRGGKSNLQIEASIKNKIK